MALKHQIRRPIENAAVHAAMALIPRLPRCGVLVLARIGGRLGYLLDVRSRRIGRANLDIVFGDRKTPAQKKQILKNSFATMARTLLDTFWFAADSARRIERYVDIDDSMQAFFQSKSQICMTAHFGNWELLGQATAWKGFPIHSIAMPLKNRIADRYFIRAREATGQTIIPREGALRRLIRVLRAGGKTAFLADQNTLEDEGGIWIRCFGLNAPVTAAPASLALRTQSDVLIGFCSPQSGGRYRMYITGSLVPAQKADSETVRRLTEEINRAVEKEILRRPEHWLWMYKRWKNIPADASAAGYPFYTQRLKAASRRE